MTNEFIISLVKESIDRTQIESVLKKEPDFLPQIKNYIQKTIIPYTTTDYSEHIHSLEDENQFSEMRDSFRKEAQQLFCNLQNILVRFRQVKPSSFFNVENPDSTTFLNSGSNIQDPFEKKPTLSTILSVLVKLYSHITEIFSGEIDMIDRRITYIESLKKDANPIQISVYEKFIEKLKQEQESKNQEFKNFIQESNPLRDYFYDILQSFNPNFLYFLPVCILDIFIPFTVVPMDYKFISFYSRFDPWIPSEFRSKFLPKIIANKEFSLKVKDLKVDLFITDTITIYQKYLKDPTLLQDLFFVLSVLSRYLSKFSYIVMNMETRQLICFVSVCVTLISKLKEIKKELPDENTFFLLFEDALNCIKEIVLTKPDILDSYLAYQLSNCLLDVTKTEETRQKFDSQLQTLFNSVLSNNKLSLIYMANTLSEEISLDYVKSYISSTQLEKLQQWAEIYKTEADEDLTDPLTSCLVVKPCFIPIDVDGNMIQVCDLYMLCTYLWSKPENPFTRQTLSIDDVMQFNQKEPIKLKYETTMEKLKKLILEKKHQLKAN